MPLPSYLRLGIALITAALVGCQHAPQASAPVRNRPVAYALAVTVRDGLYPSPSQWAAIQSTFARALAANGMVLVTDVGMADRILRIDFIPDSEDPENRGRAIIVGVRVNDQRDLVSPPAPLVAGYNPFPSPFGWSGYGWNGYYYGFGWDPYYGYGNTYFDGYSYATPTLNPRRPKPPAGSCPPDLAHHHHHPQPHPEDPLRPRRTVPPAEDPRPPLLATVEPAPAAAAPKAYPTSDPRELVFADDVRRMNRAWLADGTTYNRHDPARYSGERANGMGSSSASGNENGSYRTRSTGERERSYAQSGGDESRGSRDRADHGRYRSEDHSRSSSGGGSSYAQAQSSASSSGSSAGSSYSSSSPADSYSSSASSASSFSGASTPVGGSGPSAAPTTTNAAEK